MVGNAFGGARPLKFHRRELLTMSLQDAAIDWGHDPKISQPCVKSCVPFLCVLCGTDTNFSHRVGEMSDFEGFRKFDVSRCSGYGFWSNLLLVLAPARAQLLLFCLRARGGGWVWAGACHSEGYPKIRT